MKMTTVYLRKTQFFVQSLSLSTDEVWIFSDPCFAFPETCDDAALGSAILAALDASRAGIPHPARDSKAHMGPLFQLAGITSWTTFARSAKSVQVTEEGGKIAVMGNTSDGPARGFDEDPTRQVILDRNAPPSDLGLAARRLLSAVH
ncbi:hypothetical protein LVJ94_17455 [Pendulispora rubella]|uniref:Uncharacterized protein n=1 Tax=Pendulispora rubella TaxID=2741070 RepID=A0ABZ2LDJ3_9BACT